MNTRRPAGAPGLGFKSYKCNDCCINTRRPAGADGLGLLYDYYMYTIIIRTPGGRLELTELLDKIVDEEPPALNPAQVPATITCFYIYMLQVRVRVAASGFLIIGDEEPPPPPLAPRPAQVLESLGPSHSPKHPDLDGRAGASRRPGAPLRSAGPGARSDRPGAQRLASCGGARLGGLFPGGCLFIPPVHAGFAYTGRHTGRRRTATRVVPACIPACRPVS